MNKKGIHGVQINVLIELFILLFADDISLLSDTPGGLQMQLNVLKACCDNLKLVVNRDKSKIMVFRNGGILGRYEKWTFDNKPLEVVNRFCYLGFVFTPRLSVNIGTRHLVAKAKTTSFSFCRTLHVCDNNVKECVFSTV